MDIRYDLEKDIILRETRNISFEDVKQAIHEKRYEIEKNNKPGREHQRIIIFEHNGYPYLCPFVIDENGMFLKTVYPNRNYKKYI